MTKCLEKYLLTPLVFTLIYFEVNKLKIKGGYYDTNKKKPNTTSIHKFL